jgi:hypothetical protein
MRKGDLYKACALFSIVWIIFTLLTCAVGHWKDKLLLKSENASRELEQRGP